MCLKILLLLFSLALNACTITIVPNKDIAESNSPIETHKSWINLIGDTASGIPAKDAELNHITTNLEQTELFHTAVEDIQSNGTIANVMIEDYPRDHELVQDKFVGKATWVFRNSFRKCSTTELTDVNGSWQVVAWSLQECTEVG